MGKILDPNRAGAGSVCEDGNGWSPFTLPSILHAHSWDNPWPGRCEKIDLDEISSEP